MKTTKHLYLVPNTISDIPMKKVLPDSSRSIIERLRCFIVEDTKTARNSLKTLKLTNKIQSIKFVEPIKNERKKVDLMYKLLQQYFSQFDEIGLLVESGMPGIADPGSAITLAAHRLNIYVHPLIGPSSIILGLAASGLNGQNFCFNGYLPIESEQLEQSIISVSEKAKENKCSQIFIETPYRSARIFKAILDSAPDTIYLTVAHYITGKDEYVKTARIADWKKMKWPKLEKPTVFVLGYPEF